ncbi:MAG: hypothetical protein JKX98_03900 [Alcanivoracaceae bacterium]|nr:hypothetical protein [Alcanivoracaceae bacterium]
MQIYQYKCNAYDASLEQLKKMSNEPLILYPNCREHSLKKRISTV